MGRGMIVAPQPEAVEAGAVVLKNGGNCVDAAIACALVQGVVDPLMCGITGFGSIQMYLPSKGVHTCIDFHGKVPAAATADMWEHLIEGEARDGFGFILKGYVNDVGYQSITVPGSLKAYFEAQTSHGVMDWADVVAPAIAHAEAGFLVRPHVTEFWSDPGSMGRAPSSLRVSQNPHARKLYCDADGVPLRAGEFVRNSDLANSLRRIAAGGADVFYTGDMADEIDADMKANGGLLSKQDLADHETVHTDPLWGEYRGLKVATNHPPGGGIMLLEMLNTLENFDLAAMGHNSAEYIRVVCEAMKRATVDKDAHVGDPAYVDIPVDRLIGKDYAAQMAATIRAGEVAHVTRLGSGGQAESPHTTHISVVDGGGGAVSMTHSLGMPSGMITEGLGFMYNGCMGVFDPRPGRTGSIVPGKARFSSICPTIMFKDDKPRIVIGAPGGTQIAMGVLQAILNVVDFDMPMDRAVSVPRFSATSDAIDVANRIPNYVTAELEAQGYEVIRSYLSYEFAAVHGITIHDDGSLEGGADPGHDGMALEV
jgi:gamma-glutamyltranspeptidase/glutathione hydrolase